MEKQRMKVTMEFECFGDFWNDDHGKNTFERMQENFPRIYSEYADEFNKHIEEINEKYKKLGPDFEKGFEIGSPEDILYCHFVVAEMSPYIQKLNMEHSWDESGNYDYWSDIGLNPDNMVFRMYERPNDYVEVSYKKVEPI